MDSLINPITITNSVPIPGPRAAMKNRFTLAFMAMGVGDSFAVPLEKSTYNNLNSARYNFIKRHQLEWGFTIRTVDDGKNLRIWRIK